MKRGIAMVVLALGNACGLSAVGQATVDGGSPDSATVSDGGGLLDDGDVAVPTDATADVPIVRTADQLSPSRSLPTPDSSPCAPSRAA